MLESVDFAITVVSTESLDGSTNIQTMMVTTNKVLQLLLAPTEYDDLTQLNVLSSYSNGDSKCSYGLISDFSGLGERLRYLSIDSF